MNRETIERKVMENASKNHGVGSLNAVAYAILGLVDVMNRTHDMVAKQIKFAMEMQEKLKEKLEKDL